MFVFGSYRNFFWGKLKEIKKIREDKDNSCIVCFLLGKLKEIKKIREDKDNSCIVCFLLGKIKEEILS